MQWAVEVAYSDVTPEHWTELEAWLNADPRHRGAYVRACALMRAAENHVIEALAEEAPEAVAAPDAASINDNRQTPTRGLAQWGGRLVAGGGALAASITIMIAFGMQENPELPVTNPNNRVEILKDGSIATLSHDARIEVAYSPEHRRITLLSGRATFKVAKDKAHPFVVRSGDIYAQATGTVYSVGRVGQTGGAVNVTEGSVLVWAREEREQAVLLHAGGSLTLNPGARPRPEPSATEAQHLPPPDLAQIWLDDEPISAAVTRFNRINSTKIVIADPEIGDTKIIGLYRAHDPERFARAAAAISGAIAEHENGQIVIKLEQ